MDVSADGEMLLSTGIDGEMMLWSIKTSAPIMDDNEKFEALVDIGMN